MELILDENTFGITQTSLKKLRDELALRIEHKVEIHQIQTDSLCCGFLIFDFTSNQAVWTGDGFRTDRGGEGGAGYKSAETLLHLYGITPTGYMEIPIESCSVDEVRNKLETYIIGYLEDLDEQDSTVSPVKFTELIDRKPQYIR